MCVSRTSSFTEMAGEFDLKDRHRAVAAELDQIEIVASGGRFGMTAAIGFNLSSHPGLTIRVAVEQKRLNRSVLL